VSFVRNLKTDPNLELRDSPHIGGIAPSAARCWLLKCAARVESITRPALGVIREAEAR
jgi:hypothetical protein